MSRRVLIVIGHPDPDPKRLARSLAAAYSEGARSGGHAVRTVDLAVLDFPMLRTKEDFEHGAVPESFKDAAEAMAWAEHVVLVFRKLRIWQLAVDDVEIRATDSACLDAQANLPRPRQINELQRPANSLK